MNKASLYQQSNHLPKRDALTCFEEYAPRLKWKNNNRIIDLGCGDGSVINILKKHFPSNFSLVCSDISEDMVRFATENYSDEQTSFAVLDIGGDIPEKMMGSFDHVFSSFAINWAMDQKRAFKNIFNLLDRDSECFLIILARCSVFEVYRTFSQNKKWNNWVYDVNKYISPYHDSEEPDIEIINLMENIGFVDTEVKCKEMVFLYDDTDIFKKHMTSVCPFQIPKEKYDDFLEEYIQVLQDNEMKYNIADNNSPKVPTLHYKLLTVYGHKPSDGEMLAIEKNIDKTYPKVELHCSQT